MERNKEVDGFGRLWWGETKEGDAVGGARLTIEIGAEIPIGIMRAILAENIIRFHPPAAAQLSSEARVGSGPWSRMEFCPLEMAQGRAWALAGVMRARPFGANRKIRNTIPKRVARADRGWPLLGLPALVLGGVTASARGTTYHVDSAGGNDPKPGTSPEQAWARLSSLCSFRTLYFTPESGPATEGFSCRGAVMNDEGNAARKIRKLRASRDLWKQRSAEKQQEIRQLRVTVRDLSSSRENWKTRVKELEQQLQAAHEAHAAVGPSSWIFFGGLMDNQAMPRTRRTPITLSSD